MSEDMIIRPKSWWTSQEVYAMEKAQLDGDLFERNLGSRYESCIEQLKQNPENLGQIATLEQLLAVVGYWSEAVIQRLNAIKLSRTSDREKSLEAMKALLPLFAVIEAHHQAFESQFGHVLDGALFSACEMKARALGEIKETKEIVSRELIIKHKITQTVTSLTKLFAFPNVDSFFLRYCPETAKSLMPITLQRMARQENKIAQRIWLTPNLTARLEQLPYAYEDLFLEDSNKLKAFLQGLPDKAAFLNKQRNWLSGANLWEIAPLLGETLHPKELKKYFNGKKNQAGLRPIDKLRQTIRHVLRTPIIDAAQHEQMISILKNNLLRGMVNLSGEEMLEWAKKSKFSLKVCFLLAQGSEVHVKTRDLPYTYRQMLRISPYFRASLDLQDGMAETKVSWFSGEETRIKTYLQNWLKKAPLDAATCELIASNERYWRHIDVLPKTSWFTLFGRRSEKQVEDEKAILAAKSPFFAAKLYNQSLTDVLKTRKNIEDLITLRNLYNHPEQKALRESIEAILVDCLVDDLKSSGEKYKEFCEICLGNDKRFPALHKTLDKEGSNCAWLLQINETVQRRLGERDLFAKPEKTEETTEIKSIQSTRSPAMMSAMVRAYIPNSQPVTNARMSSSMLKDEATYFVRHCGFLGVDYKTATYDDLVQAAHVLQTQWQASFDKHYPASRTATSELLSLGKEANFLFGERLERLNKFLHRNNGDLKPLTRVLSRVKPKSMHIIHKLYQDGQQAKEKISEYLHKREAFFAAEQSESKEVLLTEQDTQYLAFAKLCGFYQADISTATLNQLLQNDKQLIEDLATKEAKYVSTDKNMQDQILHEQVVLRQIIQPLLYNLADQLSGKWDEQLICADSLSKQSIDEAYDHGSFMQKSIKASQYYTQIVKYRWPTHEIKDVISERARGARNYGFNCGRLGLATWRNITEQDVSRAFKKISLRWHPDKHKEEGPVDPKVREELIRFICDGGTTKKFRPTFIGAEQAEPLKMKEVCYRYLVKVRDELINEIRKGTFKKFSRNEELNAAFGHKAGEYRYGSLERHLSDREKIFKIERAIEIARDKKREEILRKYREELDKKEAELDERSRLLDERSRRHDEAILQQEQRHAAEMAKMEREHKEMLAASESYREYLTNKLATESDITPDMLKPAVILAIHPVEEVAKTSASSPHSSVAADTSRDLVCVKLHVFGMFGSVPPRQAIGAIECQSDQVEQKASTNNFAYLVKA